MHKPVHSAVQIILLLAFSVVCAFGQVSRLPVYKGSARPVSARVLVSTNTNPIIMAGGSTTFPNDNQLVGNLTIIDYYKPERLRKGGVIYGISIQSETANTAGVKFKVCRPNGSNWDIVSESAFLTLAVGSNYYTLSPPLACREGDALGYYTTNAAGKVRVKAVTATPGIVYTTGDITGNNQAFGSTVNNFSVDIAAWVDAPVIAYCGDSITSGRNTDTPWYPYLDTGGVPITGSLPASYPWCASTNVASLVSYLNYGKGAMDFIWAATSSIPAAVSDKAMVCWMMFGVNDVNEGRTWAMVLTNLADIRTQWPTTNALIISEILPWTAGSDANAAIIRTWNTNLSYWCSTNNATLAKTHDAMGQTRPSTGFLDDLYIPYNQGDNVHLSQLGVMEYVYLMAPYLSNAIVTTASPQPLPFSPTNVLGAQNLAYYVPAWGYATNSSVATLTDQWTNQWNLTNAAASSKFPSNNAAALNGLSTITFTAAKSNYLKQVNYTVASTPHEIFMVMKINSTTSPASWIDYVSGNREQFIYISPGYYIAAGISINTNLGNLNGKWLVWDVVFNAASSLLATNTVATLTGQNAGGTGIGGLTMGADGTLSQYWADFELAAMVSYKTALSTRNRFFNYWYFTNLFNLAP